MSEEGFVCFIVGIALSGFLSAVVFTGCAVSKERDNAVRAGVAEYYIDTDFSRQFRYRTNR